MPPCLGAWVPSSAPPAAAERTLPKLTDFQAAVFLAHVRGRSPLDTAEKLGVPLWDVTEALASPALRAHLQTCREAEADLDIALSRAALRKVIQDEGDPIERRRAATSLLRFFRSPLTTSMPRATVPGTRPTASTPSSRSTTPRGQCSGSWAQDSGHRTQDSSGDPADLLDDSEDDQESEDAPGDPSSTPSLRLSVSSSLPPPPDPAPALAALHSVLTAFRTQPVKDAVHVLFERMSTWWRSGHGTAEKCAANLDGPHSHLAPFHGHESLELGEPFWNPYRRHFEIPITITAPTPARFTATLSVEEGRGWVINAFHPRTVSPRADTS